MAEKNNDNFWESNDDDFWSKPVASDDWLKSDKQSAETVSDSFSHQYEANTAVREEAVNPYLNRDVSSYSYETQQSQQPVRETVLNGQVLEKPKKKIHVHTIICLTFITIAIFSIIGAFASYSMAKKSAIKTANQVSYAEKEADHVFFFDEYNEVTFAENAVSYVSEENFTGFPKEQKLIGIYLEVNSSKYITGANVLHDIYLGYEIDGRPYYQEIPRRDVIYPYASSQGFAREEILESYGLGNGIDDEGYLFFFVPMQVEEVTLYMPKTVKENYIDVIETVYYVSFPVIEDSKEAE